MAAACKSIKLFNLSKSYGSVSVLRDVNLEFRPGEVHAILGANGAGKSTLLGCLSGAVLPTSGTILIDGAEFRGFAPREALEAGISIIYQHFQLAMTLSVSDNVFLGDERQTRWRFLKKHEQQRLTSEVLAKIGLDLDPNEVVEDLSIGEQQGIEIARSVRREPRLLILDEPTAALGKHEVKALLKLVRRLAHEIGVAVIYVTHLLGEVMEVADRVSVLREGRVLWTKGRDEVTVADMIEAISPDAVAIDTAPSRTASPSVLATFKDFETSYCGPFDFSIIEGEIVGIYGMLGSGRTNLLETIAGARRHWKGTLRLAEEELVHHSVSQAMMSGAALVASDRLAQSLFASLSAQENLMMPHYSAISRLWRKPRKELHVFNKIAGDLKLHPASPATKGSSFSGGNAQKLVLGRWLAGLRGVRLLLLDEPTQGVDVGSRAQIYNLLRKFTEDTPGRAVLFATSDPEEAISLADRIIVLVNGQVKHVVEPSVGEAELMSLAQSVEVSHGLGH
jgi:ribose transport system ATP-binding protein